MRTRAGSMNVPSMHVPGGGLLELSSFNAGYRRFRARAWARSTKLTAGAASGRSFAASCRDEQASSVCSSARASETPGNEHVVATAF